MLLELAVNDRGQLVADKPREKEREREREIKKLKKKKKKKKKKEKKKKKKRERERGRAAWKLAWSLFSKRLATCWSKSCWQAGRKNAFMRRANGRILPLQTVLLQPPPPKKKGTRTIHASQKLARPVAASPLRVSQRCPSDLLTTHRVRSGVVFTPSQPWHTRNQNIYQQKTIGSHATSPTVLSKPQK